jgi:ATP-dependent helicase/nuclease subunit A
VSTAARLADQEIRDRLKVELDTTFFVEAGAGTGKTTALASRIVELIAAGKLEMERLAAITFTEPAAAELRDRIRNDLERAVGTRDSADEQLRCGEAARQVDLAAIQTIHSFAGSLLRAYPLEANLPPGFSMLDEIQQEATFDDAFRAWLYEEVPRTEWPERRRAVQRVLALGMSPEQLRELAWRLQDYRDLLEADTTWPAAPGGDPLMAAHACGAELLKQCAATDQALDPDDRLVSELLRLQPLAERLASVNVDDDAMRLLRQCDPKQVGAARNWPPGRCAVIKAALKGCSQAAAAILEGQRGAALAALLQYLRDFTLACAERRRHDGQANFHDLLTWARDLLRDHPDVRRRAQARFDRLFVDEFQDTDPLQVEIAWLLASDPAQVEETDWTRLRLVPGKLFVVGDPKQSIYRFRRADIGIYQQVYDQLEGTSDRVVLSQSFRSPEQLVDWFNHHFARDMQFIHRAQPAYTALDPRPGVGGPPSENDSGVHYFGSQIDGAGGRWQAEAEAVAQLAGSVVRSAHPWRVSDRGSSAIRTTTFRDICVLIPSRTNLRRLERAFQRLGVPYRVESGWLVLQTQEVRDLVSCLRAIDDPSDQVALVAALRSPAYGCSDVELLHWVDAGGRLDYERPGRAPYGRVL